jgi:hypothetical protein
MNPPRHALRTFANLLALSTAVAIVAWTVGYVYLVRIARYSAAGFFTFKMVIGVLVGGGESLQYEDKNRLLASRSLD